MEGPSSSAVAAYGRRVDALLDDVVETARSIARLQARQLQAVAELARLRPPGSSVADGGDASAAVEFAGDQVAAALCVSPVSGRKLVDLALEVTGRLPIALAALHRGELDLVRVRALAEETKRLPAEPLASIEAALVEHGAEQTPAQVRQAARRAVLRADPHGAAARHEAARAERTLTLIALPDGMAELRATTSATVAMAMWSALERAARRPASPDDDRTIDARRVDALAAAVLSPAFSPTGSAYRAEIRVTVPLPTLLGVSDEPGELAGHGPVTAEEVRALAFDAGSVWRRLVTDPTGETVLDVGRRVYEPPAPLARFVRARDGTCRFPGCQRRAEMCDLDHTQEFPRGPTAAHNLVALCRHHHRLKQSLGWSYRLRPDGSVEWTDPARRRYLVRGDRTTRLGPVPPPAESA